MANQGPVVFISYAREDKSYIDEIYRRLREKGLQPWMDKPPAPYQWEGLGPGEMWDSVLQEQIKRADFVLVALSALSVNKRGYVQKEFRTALDIMSRIPTHQIYLIPVLLDTCELPALKVGTISLGDLDAYRLTTSTEKEIDELANYLLRRWRQQQVQSETLSAEVNKADLRPSSRSLQTLENVDLIKLAYMLRKSGRASHARREAFCDEIDLDFNNLDFLEQAPSDFALRLVKHLKSAGHTKTLLQICEVIAPDLGDELNNELSTIQAKLKSIARNIKM